MHRRRISVRLSYTFVDIFRPHPSKPQNLGPLEARLSGGQLTTAGSVTNDFAQPKILSKSRKRQRPHLGLILAWLYRVLDSMGTASIASLPSYGPD